MVAAARIEPDGFYDDALLYQVLEVSSTTLAKARRAGCLRYSRKGKRTLYLGQWVLDWLRDEPRPEESHAG